MPPNSAAIVVAGCGLRTALGRTPEDHVAGLRQAQAGPVQRHKDAAGQPRRFHETTPALLAVNPGNELLDDVVQQALACSGLSAAQKRELPVFFGSSCLDIAEHEATLRKDPSAVPMRGEHCGNVTDALAQCFEFTGPQFTFMTACSSAVNALLHARDYLRSGAAEHVLVVGMEAKNRISQEGFASLMLLSEQDLLPFDARRSGLILGEAAAAVVLTRRAKAINEYVIAGGASRCDASSPTNSSAEHLADVMRAALVDAAVSASDLVAIKAHGTGTPSNDRAEGLALDDLGNALPPITSLKPYFGHTLGASGLVEMVALMQAWDAGFLPATPGFEQADPAFEMQPARSAQALPEHGAVLCNSFGFGGNNCSFVLQR